MKKCLLIGMALVITLTGVLVGCSSEKSQEEKPVTSGYIQIPDGPKIKVVCVDFPEELEVSWGKLGMEGFQLILQGTLKNTSAQIVSFDQIVFVLDGEQVGHWPQLGICTLRSHEEVEFGWGGVGYSEYSEVLEIKIIGFENISGSAQEVIPIQIPDGPKIDLVYEGPPELKIKWEKLDLWWGISGTIKNVSNQKVRFNRITFILDGQVIRHWPSDGDCILEPDEEKKFESGALGYSQYSKLFEVKIEGFEVVGGSATMPTPVSSSLLEVANFNLFELIELRETIEEMITSARLIANEEERSLLSQADVVLATIQPDSKLHNLVAEKTEEERLVLDVLGGIFSVGVEHFYKIPSPVAWAIAKGAEELGNQIAEWQVLGHLSLATVIQPDSGVMEVVYHKDLGEVWVRFDIYDPVGRVVMYIPVEPRLVSPEGGGNIILSEGVRPVTEKCRIAYRFGAISLPATTAPSVNGRIAFASARDGNAEIYIMNHDGSDQVRLTESSADDFAPTWSPDGSKIAFLSGDEESNELVVINRDGSESTVIATAEETHLPFAWSPDGSKIAFIADTEQSEALILANTDGSGSRVVLTAEDYPRFPIWMRTGDKIVYNADNEIRLLSVDDGSDNVVFDLDAVLLHKNNRSASGSAMALSPDGSHLAVAWHGTRAQAMGGDRREDPPPCGIILIDITRGTYRQHRELEGSRKGGIYSMLAWSPDGTRLGFTYEADYWFEAGEGSGWSLKDAQICIINIDDSGFLNLTGESGENMFPTWSPDATKIAFHSTRDEAWQIYIMNADGTNVAQLTDSEGGNGYPAWFP